MEILGYKSGGHDGTVCYVSDGQLVFSIEAEKDSHARHALFAAGEFSAIVDRWRCEPHALCGDSKVFAGSIPDNYLGYERKAILRGELDAGGTQAPYISVPHEMAHIACSFALSDLPERQPFYALVWEGHIGRFYLVDEDFQITKLGDGKHVMDNVGVRYSFPYHASGRSDIYGHSAAGKIMALAGLADPVRSRSRDVRDLADYLLDASMTSGSGRIALDGNWRALYESFSAYRDTNVTNADFVAICKALQEGIFERFDCFAERHVDRRLPLLISGGCGLNCDWNTMWRNGGRFESVFVPPVTNDSGIAIGAAAMVQYLETQRMKIEWDVYAGEEFVDERFDAAREGFLEMPLDVDMLADWLLREELVVAWIQGRYEIGPRALCHRSLLAAPFVRRAQDELNRIKKRESFRPVAPVCMEEDVSKHFNWQGPSPYMLYFQHVRDRELGAVIHADGTARVQTLNRVQDPTTYALLEAFRRKTGYGVLCNTSLNFLGCGFINRSSHLLKYVKDTAIQAFVINDKMYLLHERQARIATRER